MASLTVRGVGTASATPDMVEMVLILSSDAPTPDGALDVVTANDVTLRGVLDELSIPENARTTTGATVTQRHEYDQQTQREVDTGYRATTSLWVKLEDVGLPARLMREATSRAGAQVRGPIWRLADDHPARLDACRAAAEDARRRAAAYAEASGLRLGPLTSMTEAVETQAIGRALMASGGMAEDLGVSPGGQEVTASIEATYELLVD